uniref:Flp family type IVb pilin n=1 Tax=Ammonifex degensii TaxID=42838 RepID=A0A7C1FCW3_9THEO
MKELLRRLVKEEEGQGMAEYGLILALIAVVAIAALVLLGGKIKNNFEKVSENL